MSSPGAEGGAYEVHKEWQPLEEVIGAALTHLETRLRDHPLTTHLPVDLPLVPLDSVLIEQVLMNLLDNAIKFNHNGGNIDVILSVHNDVAIISVSDTGSGVAIEEQTHIFERGYRSSSARKSQVPGTGLGLHFARNIAEAHGGRIEVASSSGSGSCFRVLLPILHAASGEVLRPELPRDASIN